MLYLYLYRVVALWLLIGSVMLAQTPATDTATPEEQRQKNQELSEKRARLLLDESLREITSLRAPENRIRVQLTAADLLWKRDEKRARELFREAAGTLAELFSQASHLEAEGDNLLAATGAYTTLSQLRFRMLFKVAERDAKLAQELLVASRPPALGGDGLVEYLDSQERELELQIAAKLAETDPQRAYQIAEEKLEKGVKGATGEVMEFLQRLAGRDQALAARLARSIFRKIQSETSDNNPEPPYLLSRLITIISANHHAGILNNPGENKDDKSKPAAVDEAVLREALELMVTQTLGLLAESNSINPQRMQSAWFALSELRRLMPLVEKYLPTRVPALRAKLGEMDKAMPPEAKVMRELEELMQKGDLDAVLAAAGKLPKEQSQMLYYGVAQEAIGKGELDKAGQIIEKLPKEASLRKQLQQQLEQQSLQTALDKGKLDEVRPLLNKTRSANERISILTQMAGVEFAKGNRKEARKLLAEASSLISNRATNRMQLEAQLLLAGGCAGIDPARSFELLESAAGRINELLAAAAALEGFLDVLPFREGEMLMTDQDTGSLAGLLRQPAVPLALLLTTDFDRVKSVIAQFNRPEAKASVRLAIVESVLNPQDSEILRVRNLPVTGFSGR